MAGETRRTCLYTGMIGLQASGMPSMAFFRGNAGWETKN